MSDSFLRWGLLSTANINSALIKPLRVSPRNRLTAVASRSQAAADTYAKEWNISRSFGSYAAMLADPEIDVVYNSLPNHLHAEWTINAVEAGKHVLCEKPIGLTPAEVDAMIAAAEKRQRVVAEAFMYRHHPQTLKAKELVESGAIGKLQAIRGAFTFSIKADVNIRLDPSKGGGSIWDVGCYPISYARFIIGAEPNEVFGQQATGKTGIDDSFFGQMKFPGDVYAQFDCGFRTPFRTHMEIIGSEGTITIPEPFKPGLNEKIRLYRQDRSEEIKIPKQELYIGEVEDMADAVLLAKTPRMTLADSRANVAAIVALLEICQYWQAGDALTMTGRRSVLIFGDSVTLALVTLVGFATHVETGLALLPRMLTTFIPLAVGWFLIAGFLGLFDQAITSDPRQLWRPVLAMIFSGPLAALLRAFLLNTVVIPIFGLVLSASTGLAMLVWRTIACFIWRRR